MAAVLGVPVVAGAPPAASPREPTEAPQAAVRPEREPRAALPAAPAAVSLEVPGTNERVSLGPKGEQLPATQGLDPAISADGRLVAYRAIAIVGSRSAYAVRLYDRSERSTIQL
ncbi:MAG TPA: hypothetical protein VER83_07675, partial [Candidatus Nanopelagicales bacterium]|nr:hypothetical protein [Candidatus Nanopelagicales bacterium]